MVRALTAVLLAALLAGPRFLNAQGPPQGPGGPPPGEGPPGMMSAMDPVGAILERRDSLRLTDQQVQQLVQLNLWLYRSNRRIQLGVDSLTPVGRPDSSVMARMRPLMDQMRENARLARDSALVLLTEQQRERVRELDEAAVRRRPGRRPRP